MPEDKFELTYYEIFVLSKCFCEYLETKPDSDRKTQEPREELANKLARFTRSLHNRRNLDQEQVVARSILEEEG